jgi:hypothetical protein
VEPMELLRRVEHLTANSLRREQAEVKHLGRGRRRVELRKRRREVEEDRDHSPVLDRCRGRSCTRAGRFEEERERGPLRPIRTDGDVELLSLLNNAQLAQ